MNSSGLFVAFLILISVFAGELFYLNLTSEDEKVVATKNEFVKITLLPDLALSNEASFVRHRSLSDFFSSHKDDGSLREYFASTYIYSESKK